MPPEPGRTRPDVRAVEVYRDQRRSRDLVGVLARSDGGFRFDYAQSWLELGNSMEVGPDLPMIRSEHVSKTLFPSFEDRIPSRRNPAWPEYCARVGVDVDERDEMVLLATLGRRGPSCFVLEGVGPAEPPPDAEGLRKRLGLSVREFALLFDVSTASVQKLARAARGDGPPDGGAAGEVAKRARLYLRFPEAALWEMGRNRRKVRDEVHARAAATLKDARGAGEGGRKFPRGADA